MSTPSADLSVRVAWTEDAAAIADLQVRAWPELYAGVVPVQELAHSAADLAEVWHHALAKPTDARNRVLVALDRNRVVGFALTCPAGDPDCDPIVDGELAEITIDPAQRGRGHGSRLLQAGVDTLVADRFTRALSWVNSRDDALRSFLASAGWAADGAHREVATDESGEHRMKMVRLHTSIG